MSSIGKSKWRTAQLPSLAGARTRQSQEPKATLDVSIIIIYVFNVNAHKKHLNGGSSRPLIFAYGRRLGACKANVGAFLRALGVTNRADAILSDYRQGFSLEPAAAKPA